MKRARDEHDPTLDPVTMTPWCDPRCFVACGHIWGGGYIDRFRNSDGAFVCTLCKAVSSYTVGIRSDCVRSAVHDNGASFPIDHTTVSIRDAIQSARLRRTEIYERCMASLYAILSTEIGTHHWRSSIHPVLGTDTRLIFNFSKLIGLGIFQTADDFLVCISYRGGIYRDHYNHHGIGIDMKIVDDPSITKFREHPEKYKIGIKYTCIDGYDGELILPKVVTRSSSILRDYGIDSDSDDDDSDDDDSDDGFG